MSDFVYEDYVELEKFKRERQDEKFTSCCNRRVPATSPQPGPAEWNKRPEAGYKSLPRTLFMLYLVHPCQ